MKKIKKTENNDGRIEQLLGHGIVPVLILFVLSIALYYQTLSYTYAGDDDLLIIRDQKEFLSNPGNLGEAFFRDAYVGKDNSVFYRPLQTVSFILDYQMVSRPNDLMPFHLTSILINFFSSLLLFYILIKFSISRPVALFMAGLYAVHPMFTQAISWVPGRGDLLAGMFSLAAVLAYISYSRTGKKAGLVLHIVAYLLAVLSKETTVFLPLAIIAYEILINKQTHFKK